MLMDIVRQDLRLKLQPALILKGYVFDNASEVRSVEFFYEKLTRRVREVDDLLYSQ
jgi:hypothetical protein